MDQPEVDAYIQQSLKSLFGTIGSALITYELRRLFNFKKD